MKTIQLGDYRPAPPQPVCKREFQDGGVPLMGPSGRTDLTGGNIAVYP